MKRGKIDYGQILIESIFIVFAVSLAFLLNEWRQEVKTGQLVARVTQTLKQESDSNYVELERSYNYRKKLVADLKNGTHEIASLPLVYLNFDYNDDQKLTTFIYEELVDDHINPNEISISRKGEKRLMKIEDEINLLRVVNDSLKIFGSGNIQLKSADVSSNSWQIANATNATIEMDYDVVLLMGEINNLIYSYSTTSEKALDMLYSGKGSIISVLEDMKSMESELLYKYEQLFVLTK